MVIALLSAIAVVAMHQLCGGGYAFSAASHESHVAHMSHEVDMMDAGLHTTPADHNGHSEHPASCVSSHDSCQAIATQDFAMPIVGQTSAFPAPQLIQLSTRFADARHERGPPERAMLSVWRI